MNPLDIYVRESLFAGDNEEKVERINASYTMPRLPKTKKEYMDYLCAWRIIISVVFDIYLSRDLVENKDNIRDFLQYIVDFHFANLPAFHIDPNESSRVYKEFGQSRYKPYGRPGNTKAVTWYDLKYDDQVVFNGQAGIPADKTVFKSPEHPVNPWVHRTEVMNLIICSDRGKKLNSNEYQVVLRRMDCLYYENHPKYTYVIYKDGQELSRKDAGALRYAVWDWCRVLMEVWKKVPEYKYILTKIKSLLTSRY